VGDDPVVHELTAGGIQPPASALRPLPPPISMRYGHRYSFRVRLADLSGGGPTVGDTPSHAGVAAVAHRDFVRLVPPKAVRVQTTPPRPPMPSAPTATGPASVTPQLQTLTALSVLRPLIGYPEMRFAGLGDADLVRFRQQIATGATQTPGSPAQI